MDKSIKNMFNEIKLDEKAKNNICENLKNLPQTQTIANTKKVHKIRVGKLLIAALIVVFSTTYVAFAYGEDVIAMLSGGHIDIDNENNYEVISYENAKLPYDIIENRVIFNLGDENKDITEFCSNSTYFNFEFSDGFYKHILAIGGDIENIGIIDFLYSLDGEYIVASPNYGLQNNEWCKLAYQEYSTITEWELYSNSMFIENETPPYEIKDNRILYNDKDITDLCSESTWFETEITTNRNKQILVIGGDINNVGYFVFDYDENGNVIKCYGDLPENDGLYPQWILKAQEKHFPEFSHIYP